MSSLKTEIDNAPKAERLPERQERKFKFNNLTEKQKGLLGAASAGVAGVSLGVIAMTLMGASGKAEGDVVEPADTSCVHGNEEVEVVIHTDAPFAKGVNDFMSFGEAFKAARLEVGAGGIFEWKGNLYNTYYKEEWDAMDKSEKAEFFASIDKDFLPGDEDKEAELVNILNDESASIDDTEDIIIVEDNTSNDGDLDIDNDVEIVVIESEDDVDIVVEEEGHNVFFDERIDPNIDIDGSADDDIILIDEA